MSRERCWPFLPCARIAAMEDLKYWLALSLIPQLGAARFRHLESYFGDLEHAWRAGVCRSCGTLGWIPAPLRKSSQAGSGS